MTKIFKLVAKPLLVLICVLGGIQVAQAQLDNVHYIPPMHGRVHFGDYFLVLGTTIDETFDVTVTDGAGNFIATIPLSNAGSVSEQIGSGENSPFLVSEAELNTPVSNDKGLILTAAEPFYATVRVITFDTNQGGSLTSKGAQAGRGQHFRVGHTFNNPAPFTANERCNVFSFMATENNTTVQVTDISDGVIFRGAGSAGTPATTNDVVVTLDAGESYVMSTYLDEPAATNNINGSNGTQILSDKDIVVNSGSWVGGNPLYGQLPDGEEWTGRDIGIDQFVPLERVGVEYVLTKGLGEDNERIVVIATEDNTDVFLDGNAASVANIDAGDYYVIDNLAFSVEDNLYLESSAPVYVVQTINGGPPSGNPGVGGDNDNEDKNGTHLVPPVDCNGSRLIELPDVNFLGNFDPQGAAYIKITAHAGADVEVDGTLLTDPQPIIGTTDYVTYQLEGYEGDVIITSEEPVLVALFAGGINVGAAGYFSGFTKEFDVEATYHDNLISENGEIYEGCGEIVITIERSELNASFEEIVLIEASGEALEGADYSDFPDQLVFDIDETELTITIEVYDDGLVEDPEDLIINFSVEGESCEEDEISFTILDLEELEAFLPDTTICQGTSVDFEPEINGGLEPYSFNWSTGDTTESITVAPMENTIYTLMVTDLCPDSVEVSSIVTVIEPPELTVTNDTTICQGSSVDLIASAEGVESEFVWQPGGMSGDTVTVSPFFSTQYTVTATTGCSAQETVFVTVEPSPNATIDSPVDGIICGNATPVEFTSTTPDGIWSGPGILNPTSGLFTPDSAGVGTHTITYTVGTACVDSALYEIEVLDVPDATITPVDTLCSGDEPITLLAATPDGAWSGQGITDATTGQFDPSDSGPGVWTITYTLPGECGDEDTEEIVVLATPDATIDPVDPLCESTEIQILTAADPGGIWSGNGIVDSLGGAFDPDFAGEGHHNVTYTFSQYCAAQDSADVVVLEDANATVEPLATLCISDSIVQLVAAQPEGVWSGNGITDSDTGTFDPSEAGAGLWEITYTINTVCGDQSSVEIEVVDPSSPISIVPPLCENAETISLGTLQEGGEWSGVGIINSEDGLFSATTAGVGTHQITYSLELFDGCASTQQTEITVNPLPEVDFSPDLMEGCMPLTVTFENLEDNNGSCDWEFGDGTSIVDCSPTVSHTYTNPGTYSPSLTVLDENGCSNTASYEDLITVFNLPVASFTHSPDYPSTLDGFLELTDQSVGDIIDYEWEGIDGVFSTQQNPVYTFDELGIHYITLYVTDANGCRDSSVHAVEVEDELHVYIPNAITLNWDGLNDVLIPVISGADGEEFEFQVYDRWGALMYESTDLKNTVWLGGVDKSMVPPGVYTWKLKLRSSATKVIHKMTGHVTVIR